MKKELGGTGDTSGSLKKKIYFFFICLQGKVMEIEMERERNVFHLLVNASSELGGQSWVT